MAAHQAPPSLGFSRQEHWSGLGREMGGRFKRERIHVYLWLIQVEV